MYSPNGSIQFALMPRQCWWQQFALLVVDSRQFQQKAKCDQVLEAKCSRAHADEIGECGESGDLTSMFGVQGSRDAGHQRMVASKPTDKAVMTSVVMERGLGRSRRNAHAAAPREPKGTTQLLP